MAASLDVLHADNHVLVVAKPACMPSVPDDSGDTSLFDLAKAWVKTTYDKPGAVFLGIVHRLDRPVSGVMVFARTSKAAGRLTDALRSRDVEKIYWGVTARAPEPSEGRLEQYLVKDRERNRVRVGKERDEGAKLARTRYRVLKATRARTWLELVPETGRPHQLRVATSSLGTPLLGDVKYGAAEPLEDRSIALHAHALGFVHPTTRESLRFELPPPRTRVWDVARS